MSDTTTHHISLNPNLNCLIQNFLYFIRCQEAVAQRIQIEKKSKDDLSNVSRSMHSYLNYRKNVHNRLSQINSNISNTIIEGCKGIDTICYKVRQRLDESQSFERSRYASNELFYGNNENEEIKMKSGGSTEVSLIESIQDAPSEKHQIIMHFNENIPTAAASETPTTKSQPLQEQKVAKKLSLAKIKRQIHKRNLILEELRETVMNQIEHNDFDAMEKIVKHINEDIDNFDKNVMETEEASTGGKGISKTEMEIVKLQTMDAQESMQVFAKNELFDDFEVVGPDKTSPFIIPEVYAKQSITDLHKKLIAQLEANDSYLCFQRIMDKHAQKKPRMPEIRQIISATPSLCHTISDETVTICSSTASCQKRRGKRKKPQPYNKTRSDSQSMIGGAPRKKDAKGSEMKLANVKSDLYAKYSDSLWFSERYLEKAKSSQSSVKSKHRTKDRHKHKMEPTPVHHQKKHRIKHTLRPTSRSSSISGGFHSDATIGLSRCTTSGYSCNLRINNDLPIAPSNRCHLRWIRAKNEQAPSRKIEFLDILDDLTPKDLLPLQSEYPRRDRQGGVKFFSEFQPMTQMSSDDTKSIKDTYLYRLLHEEDSKKATWNHLLKPSNECCDVDCSICAGSKSKREEKKEMSNNLTDNATARKLLPYLQDPTMKIHFQSVTVMPVRVFYDHNNYNLNGKPNEAKNKPLDQKTHPASMKEAKGVSRAKWGPPNQVLPKSIGTIYATPSKRQQQMKTAPPNNLTLQESKPILVKRNNKSTKPKDNKQLEKYIKVQSDIDRMSKEIQDKTPRGFDRKLWANKYGKSVGHQLVSFVKNQPQESKPSLPKYALPNSPRVIKNTTRHKQMLAHLKGLKQKNDEIQTNIQKAINVIETKMIDILSAPGDSSSVEAFDLMEKEITNVLSLMKFNSKSNSRNSTPKTAEKIAPKKIDNLEEDFNSISDQLFQKLEKILDSDKSRPTTSASDSDKKHMEAHKKKQKSTGPKKGTADDKYLSSSLTSTSVEDTYYQKWHEKISPNKRSRFSRCPNSHRLPEKEQNEQAQKDNLTLEKIEREYATGENYATDEMKSKSLDDQKYEDADNSRGDCIKKDCENILTGSELAATIDRLMVHETDIKNVKLSEINLDDTDTEGNRETIKYKSTEPIPIVPQILTNEMHVEEFESQVESQSEESDLGLSNQVNKIIKRVEEIYNHLDDIHISSNHQIPVFTEPPEVSWVQSEQFLTPFMQAVKEKRSRPVTPTTNRQILQRSPSYYNVLTFLDTLSTIQQDKPIEVHTARLCHYYQTYFTPYVFYQAQIEHTVKMEKAGCLRRHSDEGKSKHKKVSFLVLKENKSCQATICPYHKFKVLKVSSQQFPSTENNEGLKKICQSMDKIQLTVQEKDIVFLCDKRKNTIIHTNYSEDFNPKQTENSDHEIDRATQVYCQTKMEDLDSSTGKSPHIQVICDQSDANIPKLVLNNIVLDGFYSHQTILEVKKATFPEFKPKLKIAVFKAVSEVSGLLQPLKDIKKFSRSSLIDKSGYICGGHHLKIDTESDDKNVVLLKSFYAFVYIIMFTALNLEYRCT